MPENTALKKKLLVLGESNSIYKNGWVAGLREQTQSSLEVTNTSLGSSGIFNSIYRLIKLSDQIAAFDVVILDTCIQDASFYTHRIDEYFELLDCVIRYLQSRQLIVGYLQFEKLQCDRPESDFYLELQNFLDSRRLVTWNVNRLILQYSDIKSRSDLHFAYADMHHIKPDVAFHIGKIVGHEIQQILAKETQATRQTKASNTTHPFGFIDFRHLPDSSDWTKGSIKTSLFEAETFCIGNEEVTLTVPTPLQDHEIIGILFNANTANGILTIASENSIRKNLANNSKQFWQAPLVWSRPLHHPVKLNKTLRLQAQLEAERFEQTEYCQIDFIDKNTSINIEIVGLLTYKKTQADQTGSLPKKELPRPTRLAIVKLLSEARHEEVERQICQLIPEFLEDSFLWKSYGAALLQGAKSTEAITALQKSIALCNKDAETYNVLAVAFQQSGHFDAAEKNFLHALTIKPDYVEALFNLGELHFDRHHYEESLDFFNRVISAQPAFTDAFTKRGIALHHCKKYQEAKQDFSLVIKRHPNSANAHCNLGNTLKAMSLQDEAEQHYLSAITLDQACVDAYSNFSLLQSETRRYQAALANAKSALQINPHHLGALNNLALAQRGLGEIENATQTLRSALALSPNDQEIQVNLAYLLLSQGNFDEGWPLHEARYSKRQNANLLRNLSNSSAEWQGQSLKDKTIVVLPEQGLGDQIQFVRYIKLLQDLKPKRIYLVCIKPLLALFSSLQSDSLELTTDVSTLPPCDYHASLLSLPYRCQTRAGSIPNTVPYLDADPSLREKFIEQLGHLSDLKVGLCWFGSTQYKYDAERSLELSILKPLSEVSGVRFFNLQKDARLAFLSQFQGSAFDLGHEIDTGVPAFQETAALIHHLDLVITCDTAVGHLAGALGKPVWLLQTFVADWRWMSEDQYTPWYPNTRLFRQTANRSWHDVLVKVCLELQQYSIKHANDRSALNKTTDLAVHFPNSLSVPISMGEFFDKISILEIKQQRIQDAQKLTSVRHELEELNSLVTIELSSHIQLTNLRLRLKQLNEEIWDVEDQLRQLEAIHQFDQQFIQLARSVYQKNDRRAQLKSEINTLTRSKLREEKSYVETRKQ